MRKTALKTWPAIRASRGIALIEALIGVLLFLIGILGLIAMQANMTQAQGSANFRADAAALATEAVGLIWADKPNLDQYNAGNCGGYPLCAEWKDRVGKKLPQGLAEVSASGSGAVSVTVTWSTKAEGTHSYAMATSISY